ncbi:hypothetical protein BDY19DRAFT_891725 [Irpex rosettiformis]|uniref:Uncharacterized protein n=1 Tax=Irpex rosettiformis TaxID=378272 RepID=A0ACB8U268_9APHY|nr:hypothetical protein BDY19DRAFT_891725 [Irpex rosettiformis]
MNSVDPEQIRHDRVNLVRLVKRLEDTVASKEWHEEVQKPTRATWIKTQGMLQKVKFARKLLKSVELHHALNNSSPSTSLYEYEDTIERLEVAVSGALKVLMPKPRRPPPILPTLPLPVISISTTTQNITPDVGMDIVAEDTMPAPETPLSSSKVSTIPPPTVRPAIDPTASLLPASTPTTSEKPTLPAGTPAFLQNSASLQEEMSEQLAQMAAQLKRNAMHFSSSLEKDKAVVEGAQEKMERNFDGMSKERVRLRDHRGKSWGTTWLVILSMVVAVVGFMLTFLVIRIT